MILQVGELDRVGVPGGQRHVRCRHRSATTVNSGCTCRSVGHSTHPPAWSPHRAASPGPAAARCPEPHLAALARYCPTRPRRPRCARQARRSLRSARSRSGPSTGASAPRRGSHQRTRRIPPAQKFLGSPRPRRGARPRPCTTPPDDPPLAPGSPSGASVPCPDRARRRPVGTVSVARPIVIATGNRTRSPRCGRSSATAPCRAGCGQISGLCDLRIGIEPDEIGSTFGANARSRRLSAEQPAGLHRRRLGRGRCSRRRRDLSHYFNAGRTDERPWGCRGERDRLNNECLLRDLRDVPFERRAAGSLCHGRRSAAREYLREVLAAVPCRFRGQSASGGKRRRDRASGPRQARFGYDPLRCSLELRAEHELDPTEGRVSHRARAGAMLCAWIAAGGLGHGLDRRDAATLSDPPP